MQRVADGAVLDALFKHAPSVQHVKWLRAESCRLADAAENDINRKMKPNSKSADHAIKTEVKTEGKSEEARAPAAGSKKRRKDDDGAQEDRPPAPDAAGFNGCGGSQYYSQDLGGADPPLKEEAKEEMPAPDDDGQGEQQVITLDSLCDELESQGIIKRSDTRGDWTRCRAKLRKDKQRNGDILVRDMEGQLVPHVTGLKWRWWSTDVALLERVKGVIC